MGNELNGVSNSVSWGAGTVTEEPIVKWTSTGLEISNIKKGDQIRISDFGGKKYLFVNDSAVFRLDNSITHNRLIIYGANLSRGDINVQGEKGIETTIELRHPQNRRIYETFVIKDERTEEKGPIEKIKDAPVKVYPTVSKGSAGLKISGSW